MTDQQAQGIGIDFGSTALRVASLEGGTTHLVSEIPVPVHVSQAGAIGHVIEFGFFKKSLGSGQRIAGSRQATAEQVATDVFTQARQTSERVLCARLDQAMISVPPYFTDRQKSATVDCARHAGFRHVALIHDSIAAVLACGAEQSNRGRILVLGLGRSAFWVSLVDFQESLTERAHNSDAQAGMDEFERLLLEKMIGFTSPSVANGDGGLLNRARTMLRDVDLELSANATVVARETVAGESGYSYLLDLLFACPELADVVRTWSKRATAVTEATLEEAGVQDGKIDRVLLVGGRSLVPVMRQHVQHLAVGAPIETIPCEAIALGTAMYSYRLGVCFVPEVGRSPASRPSLSTTPDAAPSQNSVRTSDAGNDSSHSAIESDTPQKLQAAVANSRKVLVEGRLQHAFLLKKCAAWLEGLGRYKDAIELLVAFLQDRGLKTEGEEVVREKLGDLYCRLANKEMDRLRAGVHPGDRKEIVKRIRSYLNQEYCRDHREARRMKRECGF